MFAGTGGVFVVRELTMDARLENIEKAIAFVDGQMEGVGCPAKVRMQIHIAVEEVFGNIAHYAYHPGTGPATVRVEIEETPLCAVVTFIDNGMPYDPLAKEDPDISLSAEERQIGGLGIYMVKKIMDDITYGYKNGQNILKIKKNICGGR